jgi:hypothetical protein
VASRVGKGPDVKRVSRSGGEVCAVCAQEVFDAGQELVWREKGARQRRAHERWKRAMFMSGLQRQERTSVPQPKLEPEG